MSEKNQDYRTMTHSELKETLKNACIKIVEWGWSLQPNHFLLPEHLICCPLGAVIIVQFGSTEEFERSFQGIKNSAHDLLYRILDVDEHWCFAFWQGFDDQEPRSNDHTEAYKLGKEFREEFFEKKNNIE